MINGNDTVSGISEVGIDRLITDIYDYAESCNNIINQIGEKIQSTRDFYKCESANTFRKNFLRLFDERSRLNNNILSYSRDLAKVKAHYKKRDKATAAIFNSNNVAKK